MDYQTIFEDKSNPAYAFQKGVLESSNAKIPLYQYQVDTESKCEYVFLLHGLGSYKESWLAPRNEFELKSTRLKNRLLDEGYSLLIPDAPCHGERTYELNFRPATMLPPEVSRSEADAARLVELYRNSIQEIRLLIDFVDSRQEVNFARVHLIGYSLGGAVSILVNAVEDRIGSIAACVPPIRRPLIEVHDNDLDWPDELISSLAEVTPFAYAEKQKAPTALLIGEEDVFASVEAMEDFYQRLPMTDKLFERFQSGHELPESYIDTVIDWLNKNSEQNSISA